MRKPAQQQPVLNVKILGKAEQFATSKFYMQTAYSELCFRTPKTFRAYPKHSPRQRVGVDFLQSRKSCERHKIFSRTMKVVKIDKATNDYYILLTNFYNQFQAIGNNYNQTVRAIKTNFGEKEGFRTSSP